MKNKLLKTEAKKEPQFNHVISCRDYETGELRLFHFLTYGSEYILVKEVKLK